MRRPRAYYLYMSVEMSVSEIRTELGPVTSRVAYGGETVYLTKHGLRTAALVPVAAAELLEQLEDLMDSEAVAAVLADLASGADTEEPFLRRTGCGG